MPTAAYRRPEPDQPIVRRPTPAQPRSFAELQQAGQPRPPAPQYAPTQPMDLRPQPAFEQFTGAPVNAAAQPKPYASVPGSGNLFQRAARAPGNVAPLLNKQPKPTTLQPATAGSSGESDFERSLRERYERGIPTSTFNGVTTVQRAADFVPGQNPFSSSFNRIDAPEYGGPDRGPGSLEGEAPEAYQPGAFKGGDEEVDSDVRAAVRALLAKPSGYDDEVVTGTFGRLAGQIDDEYDLENRGIEENLARRGLGVSTIGAGRYRDTNVERRSAKTELADRLREQVAAAIGADKARAIGVGEGYQTGKFGRDLTTYDTNRDAGQMGFANRMSSFGVRRAARDTAFDQDLAASAQKFGTGLDRSRFLQSEEGRRYNQERDTAGFNFDMSDRTWRNNFDVTQQRAGEDQRGFENALNTFRTNEDVRGRGFGEERARLNDYLDFGQRGFNNQMATNEFNARQENERQRLLMQMLFGGAG